MGDATSSDRSYPFRVFVSYSHEDRKLAAEVIRILGEEMHMAPVSDENIHPGSPFTNAIKGLIAHAHVFLALITPSSIGRPWVHQETGYAMALDIPVLPVAIGDDKDFPDMQMIAQLEAVRVRADLSDLQERLTEVDLANVVFPGPPPPSASIEIAEHPEQRAEMLAKAAKRLLRHGTYAHFRQKGALSSFCIPDEDPRNPVWDCREDNRIRSTYYRELQRQERIAFERHARARKSDETPLGCSLIIDPDITFREQAPSARRSRLSVLLHFLETMADDAVEVVMTPRARDMNLTILGDWFAAESIVPRPREGYRQTVFHWHGPTVLEWMRRFDREFSEQRGLQPSTRQAAIARIEGILKGEDACSRWRQIEAELRGPCCHIAERMGS